MEWINDANAIVGLISALIGLLTAGVPLVITVVKLFKNKSAKDNWNTIMAMADAAITEAEKSGKSGADKKAMVIASVKASCKAVGIDADSFLDQLSAYIDNTKTFVNNVVAAAGSHD